ncbi:MAG: penicillin-binding protein 2 [Firmicutes bacterium]|nr:penicillin-binding protein 2 [Bacillota bacterium]
MNTNCRVICIKKIIFLICIFLLLGSYICLYYVNNAKFYQEELLTKTELFIEGPSAPRGRIFDVNGNVLVDNKTINNLVFHYVKGIDTLEVAENLVHYFNFPEPSEKALINYYKAKNNVNNLLTKDEKKLIQERKIDKDETINNKIKQIISVLTDYEKQCAMAYYLLNDGYLYSPKIIVEDLTDEQIAMIINNLPLGITIEKAYERYYPYGKILKNIFGTVGNITEDNKSEYLSLGYDLNDKVGLSYLEKYYDEYLQGKPAIYEVNDDYSLKLFRAEVPGNDLYLSIDINLQLKVEEIIERNLVQAKKYPNTEYLSDSYVIISNPKTGEIRAIAGKRYLKNQEFNDVVINNISSSFTMGSVVKGATISVGYQNNLITPEKKILDLCVKLKNQTAKCSWKKLGYLNAITALEQSSNYYQFLIAIGLTGQKYVPNMDLKVTEKEFTVYREMLASYGLGIKTGIDLPNEKIGLIGSKISSDLLLNLAIGQYDTYTPIELLTYINTLASYGKRRSPSLVSKIIGTNNDVLYENDYTVIDNVDITQENMKLIHEGLYYVMNRGTGLGFMNRKLVPAGKTGTSESFWDTDNDGIIDTKTLTLTLAGFFPYNNPEYSMVVICPNASHNNGSKDYIYYLTSRISREITDFMFENIVIP